eukprot:8456415-Pyramimonas_sp.AAC.1
MARSTPPERTPLTGSLEEGPGKAATIRRWPCPPEHACGRRRQPSLVSTLGPGPQHAQGASGGSGGRP